MNQNLMLKMVHVEGALIRVLGLAERRGFRPIRVNASPGEEGTLRVRLTVNSVRPLEQLITQLEKLYDVTTVQRVC
jgi:acetolactate synthase II small subunit